MKQLRKGFDRFNLILFDWDNHILFPDEMSSAHDESIEQAVKYMESKNAGGGTDIDKH